MSNRPAYIVSYGLATKVCLDIQALSPSRRAALVAFLNAQGFPCIDYCGVIKLQQPRDWFDVTAAIQTFSGVVVSPSNPNGRLPGRRLHIFATGQMRWCA